MGWTKDAGRSVDHMGALIDRALNLDERDPSALGFAGMHQLLLGNHDESITFAERAVREAPEMDGPHYTLGWYQMFNHQPIEAIENLKRSMSLIPVVTAPRLSVLGTCYRNSGQMEAAVSTLEESVRRDPSFTFARAVLASTYAGTGDLESAKRGRWLSELDDVFWDAIPVQQGTNMKPKITVMQSTNKLPSYEIQMPERNFLAGFFRSPHEAMIVAVGIERELSK